MSDQSDNQLEELFPDEFKTDLKKTVRRARRFTILRTAAISLVASVLVVAIAPLVNTQLLNVSRSKLENALFLDKQISGPNVFLGNWTTHDSWFGGQLEYQTYKIIEGVPIPWGTYTYTYNVFRHFYGKAGYSSPSPQISTPNGTIEYNSQTEQREMTFYHPEIKYTKYMNDLSQLKSIPNGDVVETAISFDKPYNFSQIKGMTPDGVHPVWYWVDTYSKQYLDFYSKSPDLPMMSYEVYGFQNTLLATDSPKQTPQDFITAVDNGMKINGSFHGEFQQIFDALSHGKGRISPSDVKIIGVVVTGTPKDLQQLQGKSYVKAAVLGAVTNPYHS